MNNIRKEFTVLAGFVGAAMALSGYIRHSIQDVWGWFNLSLLIVGGVLLLISVVLNFKDIAGYFTGRSGRLSANMALVTVAVIGLIAIANFLGYRHHKRFDLTTEGLFSLSDQTKKVLANLPKDVKIMKFDQQPDQALARRQPCGGPGPPPGRPWRRPCRPAPGATRPRPLACPRG